VKVRDRMTPQPVTSSPEASVDEALKLMREHNIRHLPVMEDGRLEGLVTDIDLRAAWLASQLEDLTVRDVMNNDPFCIEADQSVYQAARLLYNNRLTGLLVTEAGRLVGVLTMADILMVFLELMGLLTDSVRLDLVLESAPQSLEEVHSLIRDHGGQVICAALVSSDSDRRVYSFRMEKTDIEPIITALESAGYEMAI